VTGYGPVVGEVLAAIPRSTWCRSRVRRAPASASRTGAATVKRVALELGGKSASVILDDADFAAAVKGTVGACFLNSGRPARRTRACSCRAARYEEARALAKGGRSLHGR
jgi:betaine-aldehyde dehydrogenase